MAELPEKLKIVPLLALIIFVNAAGFLLRYFGFETYIIIIGFRFHFAILISFLFSISGFNSYELKKYFISPRYTKIPGPVIWIIIPPIIVFLLLYVFNDVKIGDPQYFYEFGLSSIFDYPVYLIWNFIQLWMLFVFLKYAVRNSKIIFSKTSLIIFFLFLFEFVPLKLKEPDYPSFIALALCSISGGLLIKYFSNIYLFAITIFTVFWCSFLLFGSESKEIINLLFASQYTGWEGFFATNKNIIQYLFPAQLFLTDLLMIIFSFRHKTGG